MDTFFIVIVVLGNIANAIFFMYVIKEFKRLNNELKLIKNNEFINHVIKSVIYKNHNEYEEKI